MKEAIITSSILIICIILLRQLCRNKISACLQYALWLIVALRLIVPAITTVFPNLLPQSELSIMNVAERVETTAQDYIQLPEQIGQINLPMGGLPYVNEIYADGPTAVFVAGRVGWTWIDFFKGIWYSGMVIIGIWMIVVNILFMRRLRANRTKYEKEDYKLPIYYAKELASPCLYGFAGRQAVYIPEELADDEEKVRHILAHEYCHYKHKDVIWAGLRCILLAVYWFNPLVWIAAILSKRDCELACDESAIRMLGEDERIAYGKTLLSLITKRTKAADIVCTATTMTGTGKGIKERIKRIAEKPHRLAIILLPVLSVVGAMIAFTFTQAREANEYLQDAYTFEGEGPQTVTTSCFQIIFPETLVDKIYCSQENDTDVIIYHKDSDYEIGRFLRLFYEEATALADKQEIIVIGDYGSNQKLRRYMNGEIITTHTYHNYEEAATREADGYSGHIPAPEDVNSEIINLPYYDNEDYSGVNLDNDVTVSYGESHDYLPNEEVAGTDAAESADSNAATTGTASTNGDSEAIDAENVDEIDSSNIVLPSEEITVTTIPQSEYCYIYLPSDYSDVEESILGEIAVINVELTDLCDSVTVLSMSVESIEEIFDDIIKNRDTDVTNTGSMSKMADIAQKLPPSEGLRYDFLELKSYKKPYTATLHYRSLVEDLNQIDDEPFFMDAVLMFALIENLDQCNFSMNSDIGKIYYHSDIKVENFEASTVFYERADMEELFGELYPCSATKEDLAKLYNRVLDYLREN